MKKVSLITLLIAVLCFVCFEKPTTANINPSLNKEHPVLQDQPYLSKVSTGNLLFSTRKVIEEKGFVAVIHDSPQVGHPWEMEKIVCPSHGLSWDFSQTEVRSDSTFAFFYEEDMDGNGYVVPIIKGKVSYQWKSSDPSGPFAYQNRKHANDWIREKKAILQRFVDFRYSNRDLKNA